METLLARIAKSGQSAADSASRTGESPLYNLVFTTGEHAKMRIKPSAILRWSCAVVLCCIAITPTLGQGAAYCLSTNFSLSDTYAVVDPSPNGGYKVKAQTSYSFDCEDGELAACIACLLVEVFADTDGNGTYDRSVRQARSSSVYACGSTLNAGVFTADAFGTNGLPANSSYWVRFSIGEKGLGDCSENPDAYATNRTYSGTTPP